MGLLRPVTLADAAFLYRLLQSRPAHMSISHRRMPTWEEHIAFLKSDPYAAWYIVGADEGAAYLTKQNEVGIHLLPPHRQGLGKRVLAHLMWLHPRPRYLANIAPGNTQSLGFFQHLGFRPIQHTYELRQA